MNLWDKLLQIVRDNIKYAQSQYAQSNMQVLQDINPMDDIRTCYEKLKSSQNVPKLTKQTSIQLPALSTQRQTLNIFHLLLMILG